MAPILTALTLIVAEPQAVTEGERAWTKTLDRVIFYTMHLHMYALGVRMVKRKKAHNL